MNRILIDLLMITFNYLINQDILQYHNHLFLFFSLLILIFLVNYELLNF